MKAKHAWKIYWYGLGMIKFNLLMQVCPRPGWDGGVNFSTSASKEASHVPATITLGT